jgi:fructose-bisphosphate aldolase class II
VLTDAGALVARAYAAGVGVVAFNGITVEHGEAVVAGAERAGRPVILALSHNAVRFHGDIEPIAAAYRALAERAGVEVGLHLDHVEDIGLLERAAALGFGSVMFDASELDYDANVAATAAAAALMRSRGGWIEAELGEVGGKDGAHAPHVRTDPDEAVAFVEATGVDALAVAVGSSHAMTSQSAQLDLALVGRLRDALGVPMVLHGSSGVSDGGLEAAVRAGLTKINVGTQLNVAFTETVRTELAGSGSPDPRPALAAAREAMAVVVERLIGVVSDPGSDVETEPRHRPVADAGSTGNKSRDTA